MKSQTESKLQPPSIRTSGIWSNSSTSSPSSSQVPQITTSTITSTPSPNRVVVKTTSRLGGNLHSLSNKSGGSLQNISAEVNGTTSPEGPANVSTTTATTSSSSSSSSVVRRGPVSRAIQRRDRKERPKTMYAGRAETTNLVNLISKFQEAEKEKKDKDIEISSNKVSFTIGRPVSPHKQNGTTSPNPSSTFSQINSSSTRVTAFSSSSSSNGSTTSSNTVTLRQQGGGRLPRPTSYCSSNSTRYVT